MNFFVTVFIIGVLLGKVSTDYVEDTWEDPNAWGHLSPESGPSECPVCDANEGGRLAVFCYKKLVAHLFNKNNLKKNEYTGELERTILFTISEAELEIIEKSTDIRDLDAVITEILKTSKIVTGAGSTTGSAIFKTILTYSVKLLVLIWSNSESRFTCFLVGVMMLIWFIHKRYNKSLIFVVAVGLFLFGYIFTYLECNRKLEADKFVKYIKETEEPPSGWFNNVINSIFKTSKVDKQISEIHEQSKIKLPFCRPDNVLIMYLNDMFLNQLELIINKCMSMSKTFKDSLPFPYNIIAMVSVPFLFVFLTKLIFKYLLTPTVWISRGNHTSAPPPQQKSPLNDSNEDRITGSNLQLLLQAFAKHKPQKEPLPSGVEEVLECLKNGSVDSKSDESQNEDSIETSTNSDKISVDKAKKDS